MINSKTIAYSITKTGVDATVEFEDTETRNKYQKTFAFVSQRELDHDLNNRITNAKIRIAARIEDDKIKKDWTREELETLLKKKNLIAENETVEDLKTAVSEVK